MTTEERNAKRAALLAEFHASSMTQKAFCETHGLPLSTLQYWLGRERKKAWAHRPSELVSVGTVDAGAGRQTLRVTSPAGVAIEVERPVSESELATIIQAIAAL